MQRRPRRRLKCALLRSSLLRVRYPALSELFDGLNAVPPSVGRRAPLKCDSESVARAGKRALALRAVLADARLTPLTTRLARPTAEHREELLALYSELGGLIETPVRTTTDDHPVSRGARASVRIVRDVGRRC